MSYEKLYDSQGRVKGYKVRWRDSAGRSRRRTVRREKDAILLDAEMKRKKAMGELVVHEKGRIELCDFWDVWVGTYGSASLTPRTLDTYTRLYSKHISPSIGRYELRRISVEQCNGLTATLTQSLSASSVRKVMAVLQGVLQRAVEWGYIPTNPAKGVRKPRLVTRRGRALSSDQVSRLCSELDIRSASVASVLAATGLRPGELRSLRWSAISRSTIEVYASKTNTRRSVDLRDEARRALLEWYVAQGQPAPDALVFPAVGGRGPWTDNAYRLWVRKVFNPAASRAGLVGIRPYDLRHTFVTTLIYEGKPVQEVARQAGHSPVVCLETYAHEFEKASKSVPSACPDKVDTLSILRADEGI